MTETSTNSEISIEKEMERSYLDYAMSVIIGRALPDVRDGLKPVHRRILFAMYELKNYHNKAYKKSARVVGNVIGKYHPHGDSAVYNTMVRMAQNFSLRYPFIDGQGNFGSVDGDPPAAMRYTEVRMKKIAEEMLEDIDKETIDWVYNYDESLFEPSILPSKFPTLLVNGSSGIAVGMATNIPPHNFGEVIEGVKYLIDNPNAGYKELMHRIPGPDFPTSGIIYGYSGIESAYKKGRGIIRIRAKIDVEEDKKNSNKIIVITEIPYQVNKAKVVESIANLIKDKQLSGINYIRDESDRSGLRIAIGLKKGQISDVTINKLYKHTQLEISFGIIFLAVVNNRPCILNLKQILEFFIDYRKLVIIKRTEFYLKEAEKKEHILLGIKIALSHLDSVISTIRKSTSTNEAKIILNERFNLTSKQSKAILDMRLHSLTKLECSKVTYEHDLIFQKIKKYKKILRSDKIILSIIKDELDILNLNYSDKRKTQIIHETRELTLDDMIDKEEMVVTISNAGYIKRNPTSLYQSQCRGGKGKMAMVTKDDDLVSHIFVAQTHHHFFFFTNMGKVYCSKVYNIPMAGRHSRGKAIVNFLNFDEKEKMTAILAVPEFELNKYIFMATRRGIVKKTRLMEFSKPRSGGIIAIRLINNDELISAKISNGKQDIFLGTSCGKSIRFSEKDVRYMGRSAAGVRGIRLEDNNSVIGMEVLNSGHTFFTVTENGFGKRTSIDEYPIQKRGGKGVITIKTNQRNGNVVSIILVKDGDDLMLVTNLGKLIRIPVSSTSIISRNTQGVRLIVMRHDEIVVDTIGLSKKEGEYGY